VVGAAAFHSVKDFVMPLTDFWRLFLGLSIIIMVLVFPRGIAGATSALVNRKRAAALPAGGAS
jgi:branched-chain amino acid transport system permease protein